MFKVMPVKISQILRDNGIRKLYHFTDRANLQSIIQHGGLYSWEDCAIKGIVIPRSGSNELSRLLDKQHGLQDYVRLSFTRNYPMMHAAMKEQRIADPVILEIDVTVADKPTTLFADRNATKNGAEIGAGRPYFDRIHLSTVTQNTYHDLSESEKEFYKAEVLVKNFIPLDLILNIADFDVSGLDSLTIKTSQANSVLEDKGYQNRLIPWAYDKVSDFSEGFAGVMKEGKWGFIDKVGREAIPCIYDRVGRFREGFAAVAVYGIDEDVVDDGKYRRLLWGFIDKAGREVVPCIYVGVRNFFRGLAAICSDGYVVEDDEDYRILFSKWGFIDENGTEIIPSIYDDVGHFSDGLARIEKNGKWGYIDETGNEIIPCRYRAANIFSEGLASVSFDYEYDPNSKWGYIDKAGTMIIPCIYDKAHMFADGLAKVAKNGKCGYIDKTGNEIIPIVCDSFFSEFSEGLVAIEVNGIWNFADNTGDVVISNVCRNDSELRPVSDFSDGFARILDKHGWKFINKSGTEVIHIDEIKFDNDSQECDESNVVSCVGDFHEGLAAIKLNERWGYIDKNGDQIISCVYDDARDFSEGFAAVAVYVNGILKWGFIDKNGRAIIPPNLSEQISDGDYPDDDLPF